MSEVRLQDWRQTEGEAIVLIRQHILWSWHRSPAVYTTQTHLTQVDAEVGEWLWGDVGAMQIMLVWAFVERFLRVMEGRGAEEIRARGGAGDTQRAFAIDGAKLQPAQIDVVAILLRTDVGVELVGDVALVDAYEL